MRNKQRHAFTLVEMLTLLAVLGTAFALLLPAVGRANVFAQRDKAANNLKLLALACHNYNAAYNNLPAGVDKNNFSASARLLPFVEQDKLYKTINFDKAVTDEANAAARKTQVAEFLSPRDPQKTVQEGVGATNYLYNDLVCFLNSKTRIPQGFPDGTSNTILIGETLKGDGGAKAADVKRQHIGLKKDALNKLNDESGVQDWKDNKNIVGDRCSSWMDGRFLQGTFNGLRRPNDERPDVSCEGLGGASALRSLDDAILVALADGSVRAVSAKKISHVTWKAAMTPAGGEVLGNDW
jgi:type II secretory pathway pseudopilin PulG